MEEPKRKEFRHVLLLGSLTSRGTCEFPSYKNLRATLEFKLKESQNKVRGWIVFLGMFEGQRLTGPEEYITLGIAHLRFESSSFGTLCLLLLTIPRGPSIPDTHTHIHTHTNTQTHTHTRTTYETLFLLGHIFEYVSLCFSFWLVHAGTSKYYP